MQHPIYLSLLCSPFCIKNTEGNISTLESGTRMAASHGCAGSTAKRQRLSSATAIYSVQSIDAMQRLLQAREAGKQPSGAAKRAFAKALQPSRNCYKLLSAKAEQNEWEDIQFAAADMKSLLRYMAESCPCFLEMLQTAAMPLKFILSHDEATAGNVLCTEARLKAMNFLRNIPSLR